MWYPTYEEAAKACVWKEQEYKQKFIVLKDSVYENCYWAQRASALKGYQDGKS